MTKERVSFAEGEARLRAALVNWPETRIFGLRAYAGERFRVGHRPSYCDDWGAVNLYTQRWCSVTEKWLDFAKCEEPELLHATAIVEYSGGAWHWYAAGMSGSAPSLTEAKKKAESCAEKIKTLILW